MLCLPSWSISLSLILSPMIIHSRTNSPDVNISFFSPFSTSCFSKYSFHLLSYRRESTIAYSYWANLISTIASSENEHYHRVFVLLWIRHTGDIQFSYHFNVLWIYENISSLHIIPGEKGFFLLTPQQFNILFSANNMQISVTTCTYSIP